MTAKKGTKRALLLSLLSLITCVTMLVGSTFAWFTDSVTSAGNIIKSGTLKVTMEWKEATEADADAYADASQGPIFNYEKWEPGYVEAKNVKISNVGTLALQYCLNIEAEDEVSELADVIDVYFADGEYVLDERADLSNLRLIGTLSDVLAGMPANMSGSLEAEKSAAVTIALKMQEDAGNEYQNLSIGSKFSVILMATQDNVEKDSFDENYDDITLVADDTALRAAIAAGGNILLTDDIAFDADETITIASGNNTVLDLNGKTISTVSDATGANRNAFDVRGTMTVRNGSITTKHTGANMGWNNSTNVFNVTDGGVLNIENATIENMGGSDMGFVVHLNNWGEVTLNVDNSTLISNYTAVRVFNSGYDMNNVTITNSTLMGGSQSFWVHNSTLEDFGNDPAKVTAAAERLNFNFIVENPVDGVAADDTSNLVAEANNTFVGKIRYGFTNGAVYFTSANKVVANSNDALKNAINNGAKEIQLTNGEYTLPTLSGKEGITITGTEDTVVGGDSASTGFGGNFGKNNTIKNITFTGTYAGVYYSYAQSGTTVFENCSFLGDVRGFHIDQSNGATFIFNNCTFNGFNAFAGDLQKVVFNNCTMLNNGSYNGLNMYCSAELNNCTFEFTGEGSEFVDYEAAGKTLTINNCTATMNGAPMNIVDKIGGTYISNTTITIDGNVVVK